MENLSTVRSIVALWPTRQSFATAVGVPIARVHKWVESGSIPARYHRAVLDAAALAELDISAETLVDVHDKDREEAA